MSKKSSFTIKNHFEQHDVKTSFGLLESKFGISQTEILNAMSGDETAIKRIGQAQKIGKQIIEFMPRIGEAVRTAIRATEVYHKELGSLAQDAAKSTTSINSTINSTINANRKYINQLEEQKQISEFDKKIEAERHTYTMKYDKLKYDIENSIRSVDGDAKTIDLQNKPIYKQLDADEAYNLKRREQLLQYGDTAPLELITERRYVSSPNQLEPKPKENIAASFLRSLGF
jgi:hypothetical protein